MYISKFIRHIILLAVFLLIIAIPPPAFATNYYISPNGDDSYDNPGTSPERPWKTPQRAILGNFQPDDKILFEGDQIFDGYLLLYPGNFHGTEANPIEISSYGNGRATISAPPGHAGIFANDIGGILIRNINFRGVHPRSLSMGISFSANVAQTLRGIFIHDVEISGYTFGINMMTPQTTTRTKYKNIELLRVKAHHNGLGVNMFGHGERPGAIDDNYGLEDISVIGCEFHNNSGEGIPNMGAGFFSINTANLIFLDNKVYNNGGDSPRPDDGHNGAFAVVAYDTFHSVFAYNEISGQKYTEDNQTDNGGMDIWGRNAYILGNLVYGNRGWGINLAGAPLESGIYGPSENIDVTYNILFDNGQRQPNGDNYLPTSWAQVYIWGNISNVLVAHNTILQETHEEVPQHELNQGLITVIHDGITRMDNIKIYNNALIVPNQVNRKAFIYFPNAVGIPNIQIRNNAYVDGTAQGKIIWNEVLHDNVVNWSNDTNMEQHNGQFTGLFANANAFCNIGARGSLGSTPRYEYTPFKLRPDSSLIDRALGGTIPYSSEIYDFNINPLIGALDVGAHEFNAEWDNCGK